MCTTTYELQPGDSIRALKELYRKQAPVAAHVRLLRTLRDRVLYWLPPFLVVIPLIAVLNAQATILGWQVAYLVVASFVWGAASAFLGQESRLRPLAQLLPSTSEPLTVHLSEMGVEVQSSTTTTSIPWSAHTEVLVGHEFLFLVRRDGGVFVPLAAFQSDSQLIEFASYAKAHLPPAV